MKTVWVNMKIYVEAIVNDDVDVYDKDGLIDDRTGKPFTDTFQNEFLSGLDAKVKDTTNKVKIIKVEMYDLEGTVEEHEGEETEEYEENTTLEI